jgi:uncharacterized protein YggT (Ycf19 family)
MTNSPIPEPGGPHIDPVWAGTAPATAPAVAAPVAPPSNAYVQKYEQRARDAERSPYLPLLKVSRVVVWIGWVIIGFNALLLTIAFFLRLGGASPDAAFVEWMYRSSDSAMRPFRGIFPTRDLGGTSVFDASLLFGALAYIVVLLVIDAVNRWLGRKADAQQLAIDQARATADSVALQYEQQLAAAQAAAYAAQQSR